MDLLNRARAWFAKQEIVKIERIVTDNGACYRSDSFAADLIGTEHRRTKPYTPRHNGKVERYNRILGEEFLYGRAWTSEQYREEVFETSNLHYSYHRAHGTHDGNPLASATPQRANNVLSSHSLVCASASARTAIVKCSAPTVAVGRYSLRVMHYMDIARDLSERHHFHLDDVIDDLFAVIAHHNWSPTVLTRDQATRAHDECLERTKLIARTTRRV